MGARRRLLIVVASVATTLCFAAESDAQPPPLTYSLYTGTDSKPPPAAPALGPANSVLIDPTFGSRILRVTDQNTLSANSFIPTDAGFHRTWNANSTAIKLTGPNGDGYWLEFNPLTFKVGDGSSHPLLHTLPFPFQWHWSAVDPNIIYFLNGNRIAKYNKATGVPTDLGGPSNGDPVAYMAVVVGQDVWVCSAAGAGTQDTYTKLFCIDPNNVSNSKFIDVANKTINGITQSDPNWPTSAAGMTIGVHSIAGSAGGPWLSVTFHQQSWGGNGDAVLNVNTGTWSLLTNADIYWSGHVSLGNGKFVNGSGSIDGADSRGAVIRDAGDLMNASKYRFIMQPPTTVSWYDGEHSSWFNSAGNPNAPVLFSRYAEVINPPLWVPWFDEIILAATDGSNIVWRAAHTHCCNGLYYSDAFAQISNDGNWALFSSYWDGRLGAPGPDGAFGLASRVDTFIVELRHPPSVTAPTSVAANAVTSTSVQVSWSGSCSTACHVYRSSDHVNYSLVGSPASSPFTDTGAMVPISANTAYLYKVRAFDGSTESLDSNIDLATTVIFTDPTLTTGVVVKAVHFTELQTAINAVRTLAGLSAFSFTAPAPGASVTIQAAHVSDLRTALNAARNTLTLSSISYTDPTITVGSTVMKAAHINDLRAGVQ
jgi:hypothetical protein